MARPGARRLASHVLIVCCLLAVVLIQADPVATAATPLEGVVGATEEATRPAEEVVEAVAPPVVGATETVAPAVGETVEKVVPPAGEVAETAVQAPREATEKVVAPALAAPAGGAPTTPTVAPSPGGTASAASEASRVAGGAGKAVTQAPATVTGAAAEATRSDRPSTTVAPTGSSSSDAATAPGTVTPAEPAPTASVGNAATAGKGPGGEDQVSPFSTDGSIRAPVPRWISYVWPAVALAWPELADLLRRLEAEGAQLLAADPGRAGGQADGQGVAGVHASHDVAASGRDASSSSLFSSIPDAIGGLTSHPSDDILAYLAIIAFVAAAVFAAIRFEIVRSRRQS
jgi:hypothetical protein